MNETVTGSTGAGEERTVNGPEIRIPVRLDARTFRHFAMFDTWIVKKQWRGPAAFTGIMFLFAAVALAARKDQSGLIAGILLSVGLGLPLVYLFSFWSQVNAQISRNRLSTPRKVYTVTLRDKEITAFNHQMKEEQLHMSWEQVWRVYLRHGCVYFYVSEKKAFLLPEAQASADPETMRRFIRERLDAGRCYGF